MDRVVAFPGQPDAEIEGRIAARLLEELDQRAMPVGPDPLEQRTHTRNRFRTSCDVRFFGDDGRTVESTTARTRNISRGGLGFLSRHWFRRGDSVHMTLSLPNAPKSALAGKVTFSRAVRGGWYEIGLQFEPAGADHPLAPRPPAGRSAKLGSAARKDVASEEREPPRPKSARESKLNMLAIARAAARHSEDAQEAIKQLAASPDVVVRARATEALSDVGGPSGYACLIKALSDDNDEVRVNAIGALDALGCEPAADALQALLTDPSVPIRLRAASALGRSGDLSGMPIVLRCLFGDSSHARRAAMAYGAIVGQKFRPNAAGIAEARRYYKARKNVQDG